MQFFVEIFQFPPWNGAERMCWQCMASSSDRRLAFTNAGPDAPWRNTRFTHETYLRWLENAGFAIPILFLCIIGLRIECVVADALHTLDQGIGSHIVGNTLWEAVLARRFGKTNQKDNVAAMNQMLKTWYKENDVDGKVQGDLNIERLRPKKTKADGPSSRPKLLPLGISPSMHSTYV